MTQEDVFAELIRALDDPNPDLRRFAHNRIEQLGARHDLVQLIIAKFPEMTPDGKERALAAVRGHVKGHRELADLFMQALVEENYLSLRQAALEGLGGLTYRDDVRALFLACLGDRALAPIAISGLADQVYRPEVARSLMALMGEQDTSIRERVLAVLTEPEGIRSQSTAVEVRLDLAIVPDRAEREALIDLLREIIVAVDSLLDRMDPARPEFLAIESYIAPRLRTMESLLLAQPVDADESAEAKRSFVESGAMAIGAAGALTSMLADSDEAAANVLSSLTRLSPVVSGVLDALGKALS